MSTISQEELEIIKKNLSRKPFTYEEVYNEVLDHYATAYEQSESELPVVMSKLDEEFNNHKIRQINSRYFDDLKKSLRKTHWKMFVGNFRYPQVVNTIIYILILSLLAPFSTAFKWVGFSIYVVLALFPVCLGLYYYFSWVARKWTKKTHLKNAHAELFGIAIGFSAFYLQLPNISKMFMGDVFNLLQHNVFLTGGLLFLGMLQMVTALRLINAKIKPALRHAKY